MDTQLNNVVLLKIPNEEKAKLPNLKSLSLSEKTEVFWNKLLAAGDRENQLKLPQRIKHILWDYNIGAAKGWLKGMAKAIKEILNSGSGFYQTDPQEILQDLQQLPETALDHGIQYMEEDWEGRGELNAEKSIQGGMWLVKVYLGSKVLGQGILKGAKKLLLPTSK